ncbi:PucR family transcriptional regulator [Pseudonocardia terrae]|uniref:PucR family transcriptional regulator n=1 Tax=Pseudonocardia terrae TaxID=2905831 RepID=UPI00272E6016|nr:helix-turn-helix domain-containing protein [Pseudonocardia terrae]
MELQELVDEVSRVLGEPVVLEDRDFNLVCYGAHPDELDPVRQRSILHRRSAPEVQDWFERFGIATSERPVHTPADPGFGVVARVCLPARWNGVTYGYVWVLDGAGRLAGPEADERLHRVMRHAARAGTIMAGQARTREHLAERAHDLLAGDPATAEIAAAEIDRLGALARDVPVRAIALHLARGGPVPPLNLWRLPRAAVATAADDPADPTVLLLTPSADADHLAEAARRLYADRLDRVDPARLVAGIGGALADLVGLRDSVHEARLAARVAHEVPRLRPVARWDDLGPYRLLACGPRPALREGAIDAAVRPLFDHPVLAETAATYLDLAGNAQRTAEALAVHRQTLYYRLGRIAQLTGLDLADGRDRLTLHLALTFRPLVG